MGCGAVCGSNSMVIETTRQAQLYLKQLFKKMTPNQFLFPMQKFASFAKQLQLNPKKFQLLLVDKLEAKSSVPLGVMEKWKIILFGVDSDNSYYINCLGYPQKKTVCKVNHKIDNINRQEDPISSNKIESTSQLQLFQHKCFSQIEKDLDRTFSMPQSQKYIFSQILKRIANHFPSMGYTQGINFIVGYLLVIGYSQIDTFWMFTHIALNRRYMLLGLFQDGFPLSSVYIIIFRNLLKRYNIKLYNHLYESVFVDQSIWVFKWFITYYLYSFPIQMCQYIWDIVISVGGIGLVTFAVSLVCKLQDKLLEVEDPCEISQFFQQLKDVDNFNKMIKIRDVVRMAYSIKLEQDDLEGLKNLKVTTGKSNIYADYYFVSLIEEIKSRVTNKQESLPQQFSITDPILFKKCSIEKGQQILDKWYQKLVRQRQRFRQKNQKRQAAGQNLQDSISIEDSLKQDHQNIEQSQVQKINLSQNSIQSINQNKEFQEVDKFSSGYRQSFPANGQKVRPNSRRSATKRIENKDKEQIWDDQQAQLQEKGDIINIEDDFLYVPPKDLRFKRRIGFGRSNQVLSQKSDKTKQKVYYRVNHPTVQSDGGMKFVSIGHSVVNNMNMSNASKSSVSSSQNNTQKENYSGPAVRYCNCKGNKNKTQQKQYSTKKSIDQQSNKSKNLPQPIDSLEKMLSENTKRKRVNTHHNWMANSQATSIKNTSLVKQTSQISSEVQIYNGNQMFKKKNKGKVQAINTINDIGSVVQDYCEHYYRQKQSPCLQKLGFDEQSYDSIMMGNASSHKSSILSCQVESVK